MGMTQDTADYHPLGEEGQATISEDVRISIRHSHNKTLHFMILLCFYLAVNKHHTQKKGFVVQCYILFILQNLEPYSP